MTRPTSSSATHGDEEHRVEREPLLAAGRARVLQCCAGAHARSLRTAARTRRRGARSRGTCRSSRRRATAARCRRARASAARAQPPSSIDAAIDTAQRPCERGRDERARRGRSARTCRTLPLAGRGRAARSPGPCPPRRRSARAGPSKPSTAATRRADVGALGIVDPARRRATSRTSCGAMRQAAEAPQHAGHRRARQAADARRARARRARSRRCGGPASASSASGRSARRPRASQSLAGLVQQPKSASARLQAEADACAGPDAACARTIASSRFTTAVAAALEDARLGRGVLGEVA